MHINCCYEAIGLISSQVTKANIKELRAIVVNGPSVHPGANFVQHGETKRCVQLL